MPPSRPRQFRPRSDVWSNSDWGLLPHDRSSRASKPGPRRPAASAASPLARPSPTLLPSEDPPLSLLDRWIRLLDRSPSRRWLFYLALPPGLIAGLHASAWACGALPVASLNMQL